MNTEAQRHRVWNGPLCLCASVFKFNILPKAKPRVMIESLSGWVLLTCTTLLLCTSCKSLQPYERIYVNDREMKMDLSGGQAFENYVESIREAALPAGGQKASGGCGCN